MTWAVIRGRFKHGVIELSGEAPHPEGMEVLVLFPQSTVSEEEVGMWQRLKQGIADEMPELLEMTAEGKKQEFDRLSTTIARGLPYGSPEELERAMRGDGFGLTGY